MTQHVSHSAAWRTWLITGMISAVVASLLIMVAVAPSAQADVETVDYTPPQPSEAELAAFVAELEAKRQARAAAEAAAKARRRDPFEQLRLVGLDGDGLKAAADSLGLDLGAVAEIDLTQIDPDSIDSEDRRCLSQAIYYEARNQSVAGQMAVADVVLNRVASRRYPNTVCGVVFQGAQRETGCQFTFTCDGSMNARIERDAMFRAQVLATAILGGFHLPLSQEATNYHANYVLPYWAPTLDETVVIDDHVFYKRGRNFRLAAMRDRG